MTYSVSDAEMKKIARDLGLEISFDSEESGVHNLTTGEVKGLSDYFEDFIQPGQHGHESTIEELGDLHARKAQPKTIENSFDEFCSSLDEKNELAKIA